MWKGSSSGPSLPSVGSDARKRRVCYFYESEIGDYFYGDYHPMQPHRVRMAHELICKYTLHRRMEVIKPIPATAQDMEMFHCPAYIEFLQNSNPRSVETTAVEGAYNIGSDCPLFDGVFQFSQASTGGSIGAAVKLNVKEADIAINWAGGLHHAHYNKASGFCYINDIVLGILELLKEHRRVLYVDIDIHHGDGVEAAFYQTDRVMTVSFHHYGVYNNESFFPGTGHLRDTGALEGEGYAINVPLDAGMNDERFTWLFHAIIEKVMAVYNPDAIVLQCGADSLAGDKGAGYFNLSTKGHADCLRFMRAYNLPLMVLGGGGYTLENVARCWTYETAVAVGVELDNELPHNEYFDYYGPTYELHVKASNMRNSNSKKNLDTIREIVLKQIGQLPHAPSVQFHEAPPTFRLPEQEEDSIDGKGKRALRRVDEYEDSDDDDE